MNKHIYPCVWFNGNGKEAADWYAAIFPETHITDENPFVVMVEINGQKLMLLNGGPNFQPNPSISFLIANTEEEETERLYNRLAEGGVPLMALDRYPFSKKYGWVKDKFGVTWQLYTGEKGNTDQYFVPTLMYVNQQNGRAKEAMAFYTGLFPDSKIEGVMEYSGEEDAKGNVQHAQFHINGYTLACMDSSLDHKFDFNEGISLVINTKDQEETDYYWNGLTAGGGKESMCGWLTDKFGVSWQIAPVQIIKLLKDKVTAEKVMPALMQMKKIIIADLEAAAV